MRASPNAGEQVPRRRGSQGLPSTSSGSPRCYDGMTRGKREIADWRLEKGGAEQRASSNGRSRFPHCGRDDRQECLSYWERTARREALPYPGKSRSLHCGRDDRPFEGLRVNTNVCPTGRRGFEIGDLRGEKAGPSYAKATEGGQGGRAQGPALHKQKPECGQADPSPPGRARAQDDSVKEEGGKKGRPEGSGRPFESLTI